MQAVVLRSYDRGLAVQSDWARFNATSVAAAACLGYITTLTSEGAYGRVWRPTASGLRLVEELL